jgi:hypothetical protein
MSPYITNSPKYSYLFYVNEGLNIINQLSFEVMGMYTYCAPSNPIGVYKHGLTFITFSCVKIFIFLTFFNLYQ